MKKKEKPAFKRVRKQWIINPRTRVKKSKKVYERGKDKRESGRVVEEV